MIPSSDALLRHWKRSCWVSSVWKQAASNHIVHPPLEVFGWKKPDPNTLVTVKQTLHKPESKWHSFAKGVAVRQGARQHVVNARGITVTVVQAVNVLDAPTSQLKLLQQDRMRSVTQRVKSAATV